MQMQWPQQLWGIVEVMDVVKPVDVLQGSNKGANSPLVLKGSTIIARRVLALAHFRCLQQKVIGLVCR
jgi:hypothetical protein